MYPGVFFKLSALLYRKAIARLRNLTNQLWMRKRAKSYRTVHVPNVPSVLRSLLLFYTQRGFDGVFGSLVFCEVAYMHFLGCICAQLAGLQRGLTIV